MNHKHFAQFLYEWCNTFNNLELKTQSNFTDFQVDIYYFNNFVQRFSYNNSYQSHYTEDLCFLMEHFPELKIKL